MTNNLHFSLILVYYLPHNLKTYLNQTYKHIKQRVSQPQRRQKIHLAPFVSISNVILRISNVFDLDMFLIHKPRQKVNFLTDVCNIFSINSVILWQLKSRKHTTINQTEGLKLKYL